MPKHPQFSLAHIECLYFVDVFIGLAKKNHRVLLVIGAFFNKTEVLTVQSCDIVTLEVHLKENFHIILILWLRDRWYFLKGSALVYLLNLGVRVTISDTKFSSLLYRYCVLWEQYSIKGDLIFPWQKLKFKYPPSYTFFQQTGPLFDSFRLREISISIKGVRSSPTPGWSKQKFQWMSFE